MLPTIKLGNTEISRLILGHNPFSGNSHLNGVKDREMIDYYTTERIKDVLRRCEAQGINTILASGNMHIMRLLHEYRQEGGNMNWICLTSDFSSFEGHINLIMQYKPCAIYHHGSDGDAMFKAGQYDELKRRIEIIKSHGIPAGIGTHMPEVLDFAEEHNWGADFYMASVYNLSKEQDRVSSAKTGIPNSGERFEEEDIPLMYKMIRQVEKPCLAFKILGAGRRCQSQDTVQYAFNEAFESIKDTDAVVVGMYPKNEDQPALDAKYARDAIARANKLRG